MIPRPVRKPNLPTKFSFIPGRLFLALLMSASTLQAQVVLTELEQIPLPSSVRGDRFTASRLAVNPFGDLYLLDSDRSLLAKIGKNGGAVRTAGGWGEVGEQFTSGADVAASPGLDILLADNATHRLLRFDHQLNFLNELSLFSLTRPLEFPAFLARNHAGEVMVGSDSEAHVTLLSKEGKVISVMGDEHYGSDRFMDITDMAVNSEEEVGILDSGESLFVLTRNGRVLWRRALEHRAAFVAGYGASWLVGTRTGEFSLIDRERQTEIDGSVLLQPMIADVVVTGETLYLLEEHTGHIYRAEIRFAE